MLKKFKIEYLTTRLSHGKRHSVWANSKVLAKDPFDAQRNFWVKHPGKHAVVISELDPNDKVIKHWTQSKLAQDKEKIHVESDFMS